MSIIAQGQHYGRQARSATRESCQRCATNRTKHRLWAAVIALEREQIKGRLRFVENSCAIRGAALRSQASKQASKLCFRVRVYVRERVSVLPDPWAFSFAAASACKLMID
mmetsp:Transcript_11603/g.22833  ORF Transcript_11603/g.22833 Transcript_11603/m.22833 type:complete len:110 (+) Transcript_11603:532-861(+)